MNTNNRPKSQIPRVLGIFLSCLAATSCTADLQLDAGFFGDDDTATDSVIGGTDSETEPYFDTSQTTHTCQGQYLTLDACLSVFGEVDPFLQQAVCVGGVATYCCLRERLTGPCPHECTTWDECIARDTDSSGSLDVLLGANSECPSSKQVCCVNTAAVVEPDTGAVFDTDACPIDPAQRVTATDQPDVLAARVCARFLHERELEGASDTDSDSSAADWWYCPQPLYDRIARDISALKLEYPSMWHAQPQFKEASDRILCGATVECLDFPSDWFDGIAGCFGEPQSICLFPSAQRCEQNDFQFSVPFNVWRARPWFEDHARAVSHDAFCELDPHWTAEPAVGYQFVVDGDTDSNPVDDFWNWTLRTIAGCETGICHCDFTFIVYTAGDGTVTPIRRHTNESEGADFDQCTVEAFLDDPHPEAS